MNSTATTGRSIWFDAARSAVLRTEAVSPPGPGEFTVRALVSLISPGTELNVYRGEVDPKSPLGLSTCQGSYAFPIKYGYQLVGEVTQRGDGVPLEAGDHVFVKHPHQDCFTMRYDPRLAFRIPGELAPEVAVFANFVDVALNVMLDVPVRIGDHVVVLGQGIVGLLCALLAQRTAATVTVVDPEPSRRRLAASLGLPAPVSPDDAGALIEQRTSGRGADITIEASGAPPALQQAITVTGQEGTIAVVSYFGTRQVPLSLAPDFHFRRQRIVSSQVIHVGSGLQPRWDTARRMSVALSLLDSLPLDRLISWRPSLDEASEAYRRIDQGDSDLLGVAITYEQPKP